MFELYIFIVLQKLSECLSVVSTVHSVIIVLIVFYTVHDGMYQMIFELICSYCSVASMYTLCYIILCCTCNQPIAQNQALHLQWL